MFDYTKTALQKIADDFKRLVYLFNVVTQLAYMAYLTYALLAPIGIWWVNLTLASIAVTYFVFFMIITRGNPLYVKHNLHKVVQNIFTISKLLLKFFTIGVMLYGIYNTTQNVTPVGVILSAMMIVGWLLQSVFGIIGNIVSSRFQLLMSALEADKEEMTKPVKAVGNFFKRITGQEIEPEKEKSKTRLWLDKKVEETRTKRREEKRLEKEDKKQAKKDAKKDAKNTVFYDQNGTAIETPLIEGEQLTKKQLKAIKKAEKKAEKS